MTKKIFAAALAATLGICAGAQELPDQTTPSTEGPQELYQLFQTPSKSARPRVWWHWMNGNITKDGIRKDLLWMDRTGIVGFHNFDASYETPQIVDHRIIYMTPEWKDAFQYALHEADSLGMEVTIASSPGWSETGGPWVKEEDAMKRLVWRQVDVQGELAPVKKTRSKAVQAPVYQTQVINLPEGYNCRGLFQDDNSAHWETDAVTNFYRDICVLAVRLCDEDIDFATKNPVITTCNGETVDFGCLNDDSVSDGVTLTGDKNGESWIQYAFDEPQTVESVVVSEHKIDGDQYAITRELQISDDGEHFAKVATLGYQSVVQRTYSFKPVTAKYFRLIIQDTKKLADCRINLNQFTLSSVQRIQDACDKAGFGFYRLLSLEGSYPSDAAASLEDVIDLTDKVKDGKLEWAVPDGRWRIFRFGYSLTGKTNHPATAEATGLEVDKLAPAAINNYYEQYLSMYQDASAGKLGPKGIAYMLTDSYEAGAQTWTGNMMAEFKARKGYDLTKWLPALTGMVLNNTEETERFLFDWRRTIGSMISDYHYDGQNAILAKYGMKRYTEAHENFRANHSDGMDCKRTADIPMSAFWAFYNEGQIWNSRFEADLRESASTAHIWGQNLAAAESFTADGFRDGAWVFSPEVLKPMADAAMAAGLNRFIIHCSPEQPVDDKKPGIGLGKWGQWFDRHQTWAEQAKAWTDYLSRSCEMLQTGKFVADIAYYYGEDNNLTGLFLKNYPDVPAGYAYDYFNPTALKEATAKDGTITAPSGATYKVLYLDKNVRIMSIEILRRIKDYADAGVLICGYMPEILASNTGTQEEFDSLVADIWNSGRKNVSTGASTASVLESAGTSADFIALGDQSDLKFVHRSTADGDIYWIANQSDRPRNFTASFRTAGSKPEIWHAEYGDKEPASYAFVNGRTEVPVSLTPYQSIFVTFLEKADADSLTLPEIVESDILSIDTPWTVKFEEKRGAPEQITMDELYPLNESEESGIKYFSGAATYTNAFKLTRKEAKEAPGRRIYLDLGMVKDLCEVTVNGINLGVYWHAPYSIDITSAAHKGVNTIEVKVINLWHNRIIGDMQPNCQEKITYCTMDLLKPDTPLLPAGLIGPVSVFETQEL